MSLERAFQSLPRLRRHLARLASASSLFGLALLGLASNVVADELRIGYQKYGTLTVLKARGELEKRLAPQGITVKWTEFPAGPQLLEGMNVGSIDFGTVGEAPPVFAQAANADIVYVANQPPAPAAEALVVTKTSTIKSVAELRGKKVAVTKGSNAHFLLVKLLQTAGLKYTDITPVYLAPADARAAFESGNVDAWSLWDPFLAAAQQQLGVRVLADGKGVVANHQFYLATRSYADKHADVVAAIIDQLRQQDAWAQGKDAQVAALLAPEIGLGLPITQLAVSRFAYGVQPITPRVAADQQKIADTFFELKLIPKAIRVEDALPRSKSVASE